VNLLPLKPLAAVLVLPKEVQDRLLVVNMLVNVFVKRFKEERSYLVDPPFTVPRP
jgi:hypothetical protein